jgi:hypothetical protein
MFRAESAKEQDDEAVMQNFLFKINLILFAGSVIAIRAGKFYFLILF